MPEEGCASRHVETLSGEGPRAKVCMRCRVRTRGFCMRCRVRTRGFCMRCKVRNSGFCMRCSRPCSVHYNEVLRDAVVVEELSRVTP